MLSRAPVYDSGNLWPTQLKFGPTSQYLPTELLEGTQLKPWPANLSRLFFFFFKASHSNSIKDKESGKHACIVAQEN